jgi:hypothetical protein
VHAANFLPIIEKLKDADKQHSTAFLRQVGLDMKEK